MIRFLQRPGPLKKYLLGGLLVLISATMVITLVPGGTLGSAFGFGAAGQGVFARVGDEEVTVQEVNQRAQQAVRQAGYPASLLPFISGQVAQQMVLRKAMLVEASRLGLRVTDEELRDELRSGFLGAQLFPGGNFIGQERYEQFVSQQFNLSVPQFERQMKDDLLARKLQALVEAGVSVSDAEIEQGFRRDETKVKLEYAVLSLDKVMSEIHPNEAELKAFFDKNQARYTNAIPEKRKANYIVIDNARVSEQVQVTREDLQRYYNQHRDEYRVPDEVNLRLIQVRTPPPGPDGKANPKTVDAARQKAEDILKKLKAGANFADLAKKESDDPSRENGGELGWIGRGRIPDIEDQIFALSKGQTSEVLRSALGFNIVRVEDKRTAHVQNLDQMKAAIEPLVRQEKAARATETLANDVRTLARTSGLDAAGARYGLGVIHSDLFSRTSSLPGVGAAPDFMDAVFGAHAKDPPEMTTIAQGRVVFQVTEVKPPQKPTFDEVRSNVEADFKQQRAAELLQKQTLELSDRARAAHDLKKAAQELGATVKTSELVTRSGQVPDIGAMSGQAAAAFDMKPGQISGPINAGRNGIVFTVTERQEPGPDQLVASKESIRETLLQKKREEVLENFAINLRAEMEKKGKIRYNKEERDRLMNPRMGTAGG
ncbi:MAG TPA: peptidyl-prolyl cis-trans isomerase [Terriglobales bacterium]|jgi:peptidyl-prolyl cis-trans isomerase D|nr:peptidyl-prolyl cis-trans isomerase [Terriglobales bacterium]